MDSSRLSGATSQELASQVVVVPSKVSRVQGENCIIWLEGRCGDGPNWMDGCRREPELFIAVGDGTRNGIEGATLSETQREEEPNND